jgi:hypothetical protein
MAQPAMSKRCPPARPRADRHVSRSVHDAELLRLQAELVEVPEWAKTEGNASSWSSRS